MMRRLFVASAAAVACISLTANATWYDDFDSYDDGQWLDGGTDDGGWKGWANDPGAGAPVTSLYSLSPPHSVDIVPTADLVHEYDYSTGEWLHTGWVYVPNEFTGETSYMLLGAYTDDGSNLIWSLWILINDQGTIYSNNDGNSMEYQTGQWMEFLTWIDLDDDSMTFFVDRWPLVTRPWTDTYDLGGGGPLTLQAIDLFADGSSSIYIDDMSMVPVPGGECPWDNGSAGGGPPDGVVDIDDVFGILAHWGPCDDPNDCPWDNGSAGGGPPDGVVDIDDLFNVLGHWGDCPAGGEGACCFDTEPQCFDLEEDDCILSGGTFYGTFNSCDDFICPPPPNNDTCENARPIEIDGPSVIDTTDGMGVLDEGGCGQAADPVAGTRVYYLIGNGTDLTASLCYNYDNPQDPPNTDALDFDISVYCSYCSALLCVDGNDGSSNPDCFMPPDVVHPEVTWCAEEGVIYYIAVYGHAAGIEGQFELTVTSGDVCDDYPTCGCEIFCDGTPEGEVCLEDGTVDEPTVDDTNGGCNDCFDPHHYGSISDGETVCGTVSNYTTPADNDCDGNLDMLGEGYIYYNYRDTDWYQLNVPEGTTGGAELVVEFNAEFPGFVGVLLDNCDVPTFIQTVATQDCAPVTMTLDWLYAGDYIIFVAPSIFEGIGCAYNDYSVTVTLTEVERPECQHVDRAGTAAVSDDNAQDNDFICADDFNVETTTTVNEVTVWGIAYFYDGANWSECDGTKSNFIVKYYQDTDGNGCPDDGVYAEFDVNSAVANEDGTWGDTTIMWRYEMSHADLELEGGYCYWLEVVGQDEQEDCWFLWITSIYGNLQRLQSGPPDYECETDFTDGEDQSWCLGYNGSYILLGNPWDCR